MVAQWAKRPMDLGAGVGLPGKFASVFAAKTWVELDLSGSLYRKGGDGLSDGSRTVLDPLQTFLVHLMMSGPKQERT
jgi:hypothetical protein